MVPEQFSSDNTTVFESTPERDPLQEAYTILKEKDDEIHRLRQELEQQEQKQEVQTFPTTDAKANNLQID